MTCAVGAATLLLPAAAGEAAPEPSITELQARIDKLNDQAEVVTERYNGQRLQLKKAKEAARQAERRAALLRARASTVRDEVGRMAAVAYKTGGFERQTWVLVTTGDPQTFADRAAMLSHLAAREQTELSDLRKAVQESQRAEREAEENARTVQRITDDLGKKKAHIEDLIAAAKADLAHLRKLERQRQEEQRARQQRLAEESAQPTQHASLSVNVGSGKAAGAVKAALSKQGSPYVWGAAGPDAFDCSGLITWAYAQVGIQLPHFTGAQWNAGRHVSRSELRPGDLVFFYPDHHHVGMYIGDGKMINAPHTGAVVQVEPLSGSGPYSGAVRIVG